MSVYVIREVRGGLLNRNFFYLQKSLHSAAIQVKEKKKEICIDDNERTHLRHGGGSSCRSRAFCIPRRAKPGAGQWRR